MRRVADMVGLAVLMAAGTWLAGWWAVPALAALWGAGRAWGAGSGQARRPPAWPTAAAAVVAWGGLLALQAARGPISVVAARVGAVMGIPAIALVVLTLVFAALTAWPVAFVAAALVRGVRGERDTSRRVVDPAARATSAT